ncbi:basic proline-rich protein-like [Marmota monax]|uniref:basic proline-rich protein-like n=1 Tax=Marmota monax TaxID=9995 RepID=UPI001EB04BF4|nr:basic proline-rich protein-like [Marmota monax]
MACALLALLTHPPPALPALLAAPPLAGSAGGPRQPEQREGSPPGPADSLCPPGSDNAPPARLMAPCPPGSANGPAHLANGPPSTLRALLVLCPRPAPGGSAGSPQRPRAEKPGDERPGPCDWAARDRLPAGNSPPTAHAIGQLETAHPQATARSPRDWAAGDRPPTSDRAARPRGVAQQAVAHKGTATPNNNMSQAEDQAFDAWVFG